MCQLYRAAASGDKSGSVDGMAERVLREALATNGRKGGTRVHKGRHAAMMVRDVRGAAAARAGPRSDNTATGRMPPLRSCQYGPVFCFLFSREILTTNVNIV
ncbi:hypothetical protein ACJJTC_017752 [Scirpophaga incertulas]